ncbi:MAG: hypothetical protein ACLPLR_01815 [Terriglobales bacterium]
MAVLGRGIAVVEQADDKEVLVVLRVPPAPASAGDEGGSLRESDPRTSGKLQSVIERRTLKRPRATVVFVARTLR